jgi:hypothetical protein
MKSLNILKQLKQAEQRAQYPNVPDHGLKPVKYEDKTANGLTKAIIDFLNLSGHFAERINTMGRMIDSRKQVTDVIGRTKTIGTAKYIPTTGTKGSADISATINGKSVKIEVKIGKDRQSQDQIQYQQRTEQAGGIYLIAKDFQGFYEWYVDFTKTI